MINNYTGSQYSARIGADLDGNFVVVWSDQGRNDGSIFFDRRNENNVPLNLAVPVETYTTGVQQNPAVAMSLAGNFVIVWQSYSGVDPSDSGVFGQRFDANGAKVGGEFQINQYTTGYQRNPRVAMITSGDFIVTWSSQQDAQSGAVMARYYDVDGNPLGGEFQVNTTELGAQYRPDVALDDFGQAIVVWQSFLQDGDGPGIYGQRFDGSGNRLGPEFNVNTYTTGTQRSPRVAAGPDADFTVVWESFGNEGDPNSEAVVAQHFEGNGHRDQAETVVNATTAGNQQLPGIVSDLRGQFVTVWESGGQDGSGYGVFGREREVPRGAPAKVDAHASGGVSNVNGVLESGERVKVETAYRNTSGDPLPLTGTASNFTGPAGDAYLLNDSTADYDTLPANITNDCNSASGNCYEVTVSGPRMTPHWDATFDETLSDGHSKRWSLHVGGSFADVPQNAFYPFIENLFHNGVTGGCADRLLPRQQRHAGADGGVPAQGALGRGLRSAARDRNGVHGRDGRQPVCAVDRGARPRGRDGRLRRRELLSEQCRHTPADGGLPAEDQVRLDLRPAGGCRPLRGRHLPLGLLRLHRGPLQPADHRRLPDEPRPAVLPGQLGPSPADGGVPREDVQPPALRQLTRVSRSFPRFSIRWRSRPRGRVVK